MDHEQSAEESAGLLKISPRRWRILSTLVLVAMLGRRLGAFQWAGAIGISSSQLIWIGLPGRPFLVKSTISHSYIEGVESSVASFESVSVDPYGLAVWTLTYLGAGLGIYLGLGLVFREGKLRGVEGEDP